MKWLAIALLIGGITWGLAHIYSHLIYGAD